MKKLKLLLCSSLLVLSSSLCYGQQWVWGRQGHTIGIKPYFNVEVATDANGNAFLTGSYYPEISFANDTLVDSTLMGSNQQVYLVKYNPSGTLQWSTQFISSLQCSSTSIVTDASNNIILAGNFVSDFKFGIDSLTASEEFFLAKCTNNGAPLWAITGSGTDAYTSTSALATDKSKNIFISGYFFGTLTLGAINLVGPDTSYNIFIAKYDSNGNVLWAKQGINLSPIANYYNQSYSMATDLAGNVYVTGVYNDSIIFGADTLTSPILSNNQGGNTFLVKYSPAGNLLWARQSSLPSGASTSLAYAVTTDGAGNAYITGNFIDTVSFGPYTLTDNGLFFVKYSANGNIIWAKSAGSDPFYNQAYSGYSLSSDEYNNIYMAGGGTSDTISFGSFTLNAPAYDYSGNSFVVKFDTAGKAICGSMLGNGSGYSSVSLAVDKGGIYIYQASSLFNDTIFCKNDTLISPNGAPYFARWLNCNGEQEGISIMPQQNPGILLYPNPSNGRFTIQSSVVSGKSSVEIYNMLGEKVYSANYSLSTTRYSLDLSSNPNGVYLYRVITETGQLIGDGKMVIAK